MNTIYLEMVATSCNGWTSGILLNLCPNICLVPHYACNGIIGPTLWAVTQICIPLLVIGSLLTQVILKVSTPLVRAGLVGTFVILSNLCLNICLVPPSRRWRGRSSV